MSQQPVEVILMRQLASSLAMPIFIVNPEGNVLYFNEPAEKILGLRFDETGVMTPQELGETFKPTYGDGKPMPVEEVPVIAAMLQRRPIHNTLWFIGGDGVRRCIQATGFPLIGQGEHLLGSVAIFWEAHS